MRLTNHTDYSLRVLMYLNVQKRLVTLNDLAEKVGVSRNNLIKVSNQLAKLNLIDTKRGRTGGLTIKRETGLKNLKEIILKTEANFYLAECFSGQKCYCIFQRGCGLKKTLYDATDAFLESLGKKTLNDVTPQFKKTTLSNL